MLSNDDDGIFEVQQETKNFCNLPGGDKTNNK